MTIGMLKCYLDIFTMAFRRLAKLFQKMTLHKNTKPSF